MSHRPTQEEIDRFRSSGVLDEKWYTATYPDVAMLNMDPVEHYLWIGARLNRALSEKQYAQRRRSNLDRQHATQPDLAPQISKEPRQELADADPNASTYSTNRPYDFPDKRQIEATGKQYLSQRDSGRAIAFYSAVTGGYDHPYFHEHLLPQADYYLFSDTPEDAYVYQARTPPLFDIDPVRMARFVKTHPHMLFPEHRIAVWLDGNILIRGDLSDLIARFDQSGLPVGAIPHPLRTSIYEEAAECVKRAKDEVAAIEAQMTAYRAEGFDCSDLIESNLMMFRLDHPALPKIMNAWWAEIEKGSRRDQLSFNHALHKAGASYFPLTARPNSVRNHPALALFHHGSIRTPFTIATMTSAPANRCYAEVMQERLYRFADCTADVIVCVHNALPSVIECLNSLAKSRDSRVHRIVIVDDGSNPETRQWLEQFSSATGNVTMIRNETAGGYTKAANKGLQASNAEVSILLNSDTIVAGRWIEKIVDAIKSNPGVGIAGPLSSAASHQSIPDHRSSAGQTAINDIPPGYSVMDMNEWCERNSPADFTPRVPLVHGFCFGIAREVVQRIGGFDEHNFPNGYGEENDYCFRAVNAGFSLAVALHTYVYHEKSQSYQGERREKLMKEGNQRIRDLHSKSRVLRAVKSMQDNPHLVRMRTLARTLFNP
jgi:GT2 family glycosyltransferase